MIKISYRNFQNQTIETIEVNGETVDNLEIKLTKTKFNICNCQRRQKYQKRNQKER